MRDGIEAARAYWLSTDSLLGYSMAKPAVAQAVRQMVEDYSCWHLLHSDTAIAIHPPPATRLSEIRAPTLVMVGEHDDPEFLKMGDTLHAQIPGARKQVIQGAGHLPNLEQPALVNQLLVDFLSAAGR